MVNFLNIFRRKEDIQDFLKKLFVGGYSRRFVRDIYGEKVLTPHEEMKECRRVFNTNTLVEASIKSLRDMIIGSEVTVDTDDEATKSFFKNWFENTNFFESFFEAVENVLIFGNAYMEIVPNNASGLPMRFYPITRPEFIWADVDDKGNVKGFVQEIPYAGKSFNTFKVKYVNGVFRSVRGIYLPKDRIIHLKLGVGDVVPYGRSSLASGLGDADILREVEKSIAIISRYKAIPKKIISLKGANRNDILNFKNQLSHLEDYENPITNAEVGTVDLSYQGDSSSMSLILDYFKRKLTVGLAPEYLIHGQEVNRATSKEQGSAFKLRIMAMRYVLSKPINKILRSVASFYNLDPEVSLKFGDFIIDSEDDKISKATNLFNNGLITLNEAREMIGLEPDGEVGGFYSFDLKNQNPLQQMLNNGGGE